MGIQINGNNDIISALDGSWTAEGASINTSGILTATTFKGNIVGTAATFTGPVTIGGTLTYEDVTNIDAVGVVTARNGIRVGAGKSIGSDSGTVTYYGDGSALTGITQTTINNNANDRIITGSGTANTLEGESNVTWNGTDFKIGTSYDNTARKLKFNNGKFEMYSTGDTSSGGSYVTTSHHGLFLGCAATSAFMNQSFSQFRLTTTDSTVKLYSGGNTKLQTTNTGIDVTGGITATGEVTIPTWLVHAGDSNTKFGFEGPDTITFETAGDERLRIDGAGDIFIGTSTDIAPTNGTNLCVSDATISRLILEKQSTIKFGLNVSNGFTIYDETNDAARFSITSTGEVRIDGPTAAAHGLRFTPNGWNSYDNRMGYCGTSGADFWWSSNWNPTDGARDHSGYATNFIRQNISSGYLSFGTGAVNTSASERLRIQSTGQILYSAASGDNQITSKRTNAAGSNGNYFFHLKAQDNNANNVGELGFHRESAVDDSYFIVKTRNTGGSSQERLRILSTGEVLIGRTTKANDINKLVVHGTSPADNYDSQLYLEGSETSGAINTGGALAFGGHDGGTARNWANIYGMKENGNANDRASYMSFHTRPGGGGVTERLRINSLGVLQIKQTTNTNQGIEWYAASGDKSASIGWGNGNANFEFKNFRADSQSTGPYGNIDFFTGSTSSPPLVMRMQVTGEVGIGTDNPLQKLDVRGGQNNTSIQCDNHIRINTNTNGSHLVKGSGVTYVSGTGGASDGNWKDIFTNWRYSAGSFVAAIGDTTVKTMISGHFYITAPNYGVVVWNEITNNNSWNSGVADMQIVTHNTSNYKLQIKHTSYYDTSNNFAYYIMFNFVV